MFTYWTDADRSYQHALAFYDMLRKSCFVQTPVGLKMRARPVLYRSHPFDVDRAETLTRACGSPLGADRSLFYVMELDLSGQTDR